MKTYKINSIEKKFSPEALKCLVNYDWSGNVRELKNLIEKLIILTDVEMIDTCSLPEEIHGHVGVKDYKPDVNTTLSDLERQHIINTLSNLSGNKTRVAEALGISLKTLYNKLKLYNISY